MREIKGVTSTIEPQAVAISASVIDANINVAELSTGLYQYDVLRFEDKAEYLAYQAGQQQADLAGLQNGSEITMLAIADLYERQLAAEESQKTIMLAIAELYETQTGNA